MESGIVSAEKFAPLRQDGASGKRCDIDGQPERASVWENASQCEELTAIFVTILAKLQRICGEVRSAPCDSLRYRSWTQPAPERSQREDYCYEQNNRPGTEKNEDAVLVH